MPSRIGHVRSRAVFLALTLAAVTCAILAGWRGARRTNTNRTTTSSPAQSPASSPHVTGPLGSPGNPLVLSCAAEAWPGYPDPPAPVTPGPHDLAVGPIYFPVGLALATYTPAQFGYAPFGRHGRFYNLPLVVRPGATVTVTIGASARGHVEIATGSSRVTSASDQACRKAGGFF